VRYRFPDGRHDLWALAARQAAVASHPDRQCHRPRRGQSKELFPDFKMGQGIHAADDLTELLNEAAICGSGPL